jgi:hypothetical protein
MMVVGFFFELGGTFHEAFFEDRKNMAPSLSSSRDRRSST